MRDNAQETTPATLGGLPDYLPDLLGALLVVVLGWLLARLFRLLVKRAIRAVNVLLHRSALYRAGIPRGVEQLLGAAAFWITLMVALSVAVPMAGVTGASQWLDRLVVFLPDMVAGGLIIITGFVAGAIARNLISHGATVADLPQASMLGHSAQAVFVLLGLVIGLGQVGVDVSLLVIVIAITLAALLGGIALAFGLGARALVENLVAVRQLRQLLPPGQLADIGGCRGRILELTSTSVVLETAEGRRLIPASLCLREPITLITGSPDRESTQP